MLLLRRLYIQATADRRRLGVLCALMLLGVVLWGRNILKAQNETRGSQGSTSAGETPDRSPETDNPGPPPIQVALDRVPNRDPLSVDVRAFPRPNQIVVLPNENPKPGDDEAENERQRRLQSLANRFELEAVMIGRPLAVINGKTYRTRDYIPQNENERKLSYKVPAVGKPETEFELVDIVSREDQGDREYLTYVVLEYQGARYRVHLKN